MVPSTKLLSTPRVVWPLGMKDSSSSLGPNQTQARAQVLLFYFSLCNLSSMAPFWPLGMKDSNLTLGPFFPFFSYDWSSMALSAKPLLTPRVVQPFGAKDENLNLSHFFFVIVTCAMAPLGVALGAKSCSTREPWTQVQAWVQIRFYNWFYNFFFFAKPNEGTINHTLNKWDYGN